MTPRELDLHVHAGLERVDALERMLALAEADGRKVCGLLDHAELYSRRPPSWGESALDAAALLPDKEALLERRLEGPGVFYESAREAVAQYSGLVRFAVGLEVGTALLPALPREWLDGADFLGICSGLPGRARWGEYLADALRRARELAGEKPVILHHPFRWRFATLAAEIERNPYALDPSTLFTESDADTLAAAARECGAYVEVNVATFQNWARGESARLVARRAFDWLRERGVRFSLGSDMHALPASYSPEETCEALGVRPEDLRSGERFLLPRPLGPETFGVEGRHGDTESRFTRKGRRAPRPKGSPGELPS